MLDPEFGLVVADSKDLTWLLTVVASFPFLPFANFLSNGFDNCCYSVKAGFILFVTALIKLRRNYSVPADTATDPEQLHKLKFRLF